MIFSRAGFKALKFAYIVVLAGIGVGAFLVVGSYLYWQSEKKHDQQSQRALQDLRGRLNTATRDRDDLRGSEATFNTLASRGIFMAEERLDLIEALAALKKRHQLVSLTYEVAPQRSLRLSTGTAYSGVTLVASRVKLKIRALHDADLFDFLDEFPRLQRGFFPLDRCAIKRNTALQAIVATAKVPQNDDDDTAPTAPSVATPSTRSTAAASAVAALEAECSLEWITLQTKDGNGTKPTAAVSAQNARPL